MSKELVGWRATYTDGTRYESSQHKWEDLPIYGIQVLFKYWSDGTSIRVDNHNGADCYYVYPVKKISDIPTKVNIKFGEELPFEEFQALWEQEYEYAKQNIVDTII